MKYFKRSAITLVSLALFYSIFPQTAYAYLDPGTGSYILQMIIAVLIGTIMGIKIYWRKIKAIFTNIFSKIQKHKKDDD